LGAFLAQSAKNRAFRSNSSVLLSQALRDFRFNPWRTHQRHRREKSPQSRRMARAKKQRKEEEKTVA
jgi:hypothetical protein